MLQNRHCVGLDDDVVVANLCARSDVTVGSGKRCKWVFLMWIMTLTLFWSSIGSTAPKGAMICGILRHR